MSRFQSILALSAIFVAGYLCSHIASNNLVDEILQKHVSSVPGLASAFLAVLSVWVLSSYFSRDNADDTKLYGLEHAVLNLADVPPREMWMNMGYWENESTFSSACRALLAQTLQHAGLLVRDHNGTIRRSSAKSVNLVDVGFGCGDQTLYLTRELFSEEQSEERRPIVDNYVGITINKVQATFALDRLKRSDDAATDVSITPHIFCADAANPTEWPDPLKKTLSRSFSKGNDSFSSTWLLALDTMYHFRPSRQHILSHARNELHASLMAFDLLLSDSATLWQRLILRVICLVASTPYTNFVSRTEYIDMLLQAGYARDRIEVKDVSEHVFSGIAAYTQRREEQLRPFGMGLGKLKGLGRCLDGGQAVVLLEE